MNKIFSDRAWEEYTSFLKEDRKILKRIHELLKDIDRNGHEGIGKPEPLRHTLSGYWSRRINQEHRLIYSIDGENIYILSCKYHYTK